MNIKKAARSAYLIFQERGWEYFDGPPTRKRLEDVITMLIRDVSEPGTTSAATGRFVVTKNKREGEDPIVTVALILGEI